MTVIHEIDLINPATNKLMFRFSAIEKSGHDFISTFWDVEADLENDRRVRGFETSSGALIDMYREAFLTSAANKYIVEER